MKIGTLKTYQRPHECYWGHPMTMPDGTSVSHPCHIDNNGNNDRRERTTPEAIKQYCAVINWTRISSSCWSSWFWGLGDPTVVIKILSDRKRYGWKCRTYGGLLFVDARGQPRSYCDYATLGHLRITQTTLINFFTVTVFISQLFGRSELWLRKGWKLRLELRAWATQRDGAMRQSDNGSEDVKKGWWKSR